MLTLLAWTAWRHLKQRPGHTLRAVAAVMVGVGALVGTLVTNAAMSLSFEESIRASTGRADLEVTAGETGLSETFLETVQAVPGVVTAAPRVTASAYVVGTSGEVLTVVGIDITQEDRVGRYAANSGDEVIEDPLEFLSQPDSILLTRTYAARHEIQPGDRIELRTALGKRSFTVRGLLPTGGAAAAFGGNLAVMDYQAAQVVFGKRDRLDAVDVVAEPKTDLDRLVEQIRSAVGPGLVVDRPLTRAQSMATATRSLRLLSWLFSSLTLVVGMFLLYNAVAQTVVQRGREIAILRALGLRARMSVSLILAEAALIGVGGAAAGIPFGVALARVQLGPLTQSVNTLLLTNVGSLRPGPLDGGEVALAMIAGLLATLAAAWFPAREALHYPPATAGRVGAVGALRQNRISSPWLGVGWLALGVGATAVGISWESSLVAPVADAAFILGVAVLAPTVARLVLPLMARVFRLVGSQGELAVIDLAANPRRSALSASPLMVAVAFVVIVASIVQSFRGSLIRWVEDFAPDDLQIASVSHDLGKNVLLPASFGDAVAAVPGVAGVRRYRLTRIMYRGRRIALDAQEFDEHDIYRGYLHFRRGDPASAFPRLARGEAVAVSENFADSFDFEVGSEITLPTPGGTKTLPILAVVTNFNSDQGTVVLSRRLFLELFGDDRFDFVLTRIRPGTSAEAVREAVAGRYGEEFLLVILTNAEFRQDLIARIDAAFAPLAALFGLAVIVGCLGVSNSLYIATTERVREFGILRSIGARRRQIIALVVTEAAVIGMLGALLGLALGALLSYVWVVVHVRHTLGWSIDYAFGMKGTLIGLPVALVTATFAGLYPGWRAAHQPAVVALSRE